MNNELVSIIVPIYNVEECLEKCVRSIIEQTYKNIEIILVDDGSTDNCGVICDNYKKIDNRIVVVHKRNEGLSSARNKGLDIAKGKYISFVDSDDYIEPKMIEELMQNMSEYKSDIAICNFYCIKNGIKLVKRKYIKKSFSIEGRKKYENIQGKYSYVTLVAWNKLYKREIFDTIRYPKGRIYEDSYVLCDILEKAQRISYILKPLYNYVYRSNSIINTFNIKHFDMIESYNRKIEFLSKKKYYDLVKIEKNMEMNDLIVTLSKLKLYKIKNTEIEKKCYQIICKLDNEITMKGITKYNILYKILKNKTFDIIALLFKLKRKIIK